MWPIHARPRAPGRLVLSAVQVRHGHAIPRRVLKKSDLVVEGDVAKRLEETNLWRPHKAKKVPIKIHGEKTRVNIAGEKLCDDIGKYIGPSLQRHAGCDLIDLFPGAGAWSRKLNEIVKPRRHILMEPDAALYAPFLEPLTSKPETTLLTKSGLYWTDLMSTLESLDQTPRDPDSDAPPARNDTLLLTANLSVYPKTRMTAFYIYQLISAVRTGAFLQSYGLVRMLIWARPEDIRRSVLPAAVHLRTRAGIEAELACEWLDEVAGPDYYGKEIQAEVFRAKKNGGPRDRAVDLYSACRTLRRMNEEGITMPEERETELIREARGIRDVEGELGDRMLTPSLALPFAGELEALERRFFEGDFGKESDEFTRLKRLRYRQTSNAKQAGEYVELLREHDDLARMRRAGTATEEEFRRAEKLWNDKVDALNPHSLSNFRLLKDNLHLARQDPPPLLWDRRRVEPLAARPAEFFPNIPSSLLDIQPKAPSPLITASGEGAAVFELLAKVLLRSSRAPVAEKLEEMWTGASGILADCPSLTDPARGGSRIGGHGAVSVRCLNEGQWEEIIRAWLAWPFRPSVETLVKQHGEEEEEEEDEAHGVNEFYL